MSGVYVGIGTAVGAMYSADKAKSAAHKQLVQQQKLADQEEERIRKQMEQQKIDTATALAQTEKQIAMAAEQSARLQENEKQRSAADTATREAARQTDAATAQVDVAGATDTGSRRKRRQSFFTSDSAASTTAASSFRV